MNHLATGDPLGSDPTWLATVADQLAEVRDVRSVTLLLVQASRRIVEGADMVSLTLDRGREPRSTATDRTAAELDVLQRRLGDGPCLDAVRASGLGLAFAADLSDEPPWPGFARDARAKGINGVLSVGLLPTSKPPRGGTLTFYSRTPGALPTTGRDAAVVVAAHAGVLITMVGALERSDRRAYHLSRALTSRDLIGQAKGILMRSHGLNAEKAFGLLSELSQRLNVKLHDLAAQVVANSDEIDPTTGILPRRGRGLGSAN